MRPVTASGVLMAKATRDLGPLTTWDGIHIAYMHLATDVRSATGPGPCDPEASPVNASAMEMQERWDRASSHDFLNAEGADGPARLDELGAGLRSSGSASGFSHGFTDVIFHGTRHGRQLCVTGNASFVMFDESGSSSDTGGLGLRPCLTLKSSLS